MRARFLIVATAMACAAVAAWRLDILDGFPAIGRSEAAMLGFVLAYGAAGVVMAFLGRWDDARHFANGVPMWGLCMTGLGVVEAIAPAHDPMLRAVGGALLANFAAVGALAIVREFSWWCARSET